MPGDSNDGGSHQQPAGRRTLLFTFAIGSLVGMEVPLCEVLEPDAAASSSAFHPGAGINQKL
jgi:hypothetical protein